MVHRKEKDSVAFNFVDQESFRSCQMWFCYTIGMSWKVNREGNLCKTLTIPTQSWLESKRMCALSADGALCGIVFVIISHCFMSKLLNSAALYYWWYYINNGGSIMCGLIDTESVRQSWWFPPQRRYPVACWWWRRRWMRTPDGPRSKEQRDPFESKHVSA